MLFGRIRKMLGRKQPSAKVAWSSPDSGTKVAWERKEASAPNAPSLATSRKNEAPTANRTATHNSVHAPSNNNVAQGKRSEIANHLAQGKPNDDANQGKRLMSNGAAQAQGNSANNNNNSGPMKRSQINHRGAERTDAKNFMAAVTDSGNRNLMQGKARNENLRTKTKERTAEALTVRHRSGSVTELHLEADSSSVKEAFHKSVTTGDTTQLRNRDIRGSAKRDLNKFARKRDKRE